MGILSDVFSGIKYMRYTSYIAYFLNIVTIQYIYFVCLLACD